MKNEFENQLDIIRVELYEKSKGMSNADAVKAANASGRRIAKKYGITLAKSAARQPVPKTNAQ